MALLVLGLGFCAGLDLWLCCPVFQSLSAEYSSKLSSRIPISACQRLRSQPTVALACGHVYHLKCIASGSTFIGDAFLLMCVLDWYCQKVWKTRLFRLIFAVVPGFLAGTMHIWQRTVPSMQTQDAQGPVASSPVPCRHSKTLCRGLGCNRRCCDRRRPGRCHSCNHSLSMS